MEVGKYTFAPNEAFCQLVARLHKSNNGGCFHHFTTINCRSFGDSFVNKMAHEDFFLVVWQAIVITRPFSSIRHTVQCSQNLKFVFFSDFRHLQKYSIPMFRYLQFWHFLFLRFKYLSLLINFCVYILWPVKKRFRRLSLIWIYVGNALKGKFNFCFVFTYIIVSK